MQDKRKNHNKISLICTVLNEEENIEDFIISITKQSVKPDEFIIVDGGSTDKTYEIIKKISKKFKWIIPIQKKGANIPHGRNLAFKKAKNNIIVVCDAGGKYSKDWIKNLIKGFNGDISFGWDSPWIKNKFQEKLAKSILHKNQPCSSRNLIIRKSLWKEVGGYPEDMIGGEDTFFNERIKEKGYKLKKIKDAVCLWEMRNSLKEVKKQYRYHYAYWDGVSLRRHGKVRKKYLVVAIGMLFLLPFYPLLWLISRMNLSWKIIFEKRFSYFFGFWEGYIEEMKYPNAAKRKIKK